MSKTDKTKKTKEEISEEISRKAISMINMFGKLFLGIFILLAMVVYVQPEIYAPLAWELGIRILSMFWWVLVIVVVLLIILGVTGLALSG